MLPSKPDDCNRGILQRSAFELFLQRYDLLSELVARLQVQSGGSIPRARISDSLIGTLWRTLSRRNDETQKGHQNIFEDDQEVQVAFPPACFWENL